MAAENYAYRHKSQYARDTLNAAYEMNKSLDAGNRIAEDAAFRAQVDARLAREQSQRHAQQARADARQARQEAARHAAQAREDAEAQLQAQHVANDHLATISALTGQGFAMIDNRLATMSDQLDDIAYSTANRLSTEANELFRLGLNSVQQGWHEEAIGQLTQAVSKVETEGIFHLVLGMAQAQVDRRPEAAASFARALRYSSGSSTARTAIDQAPLAASAALQFKAVAGEEDATVVLQMIETALRIAPSVPELRLARGQLTGNRDDVRQAIRQAPELALVAAMAEVDGALQAAGDVYDDPDGPVQARLAAVEHAGDIDIWQPRPADVAAALTGHTDWLLNGSASSLQRQAESVISERDTTEAAARQLRESLAQAERRADATQQNLRAAEAALAQTRSEVRYLGLAKPLVPLVIALLCFLGGSGAAFFGVVALFFAIKWGKRWYEEYSVASQAHTSTKAYRHQEQQHAASSAQAASTGARSAFDRLAATEAEAARLRGRAEVANQVLRLIGRANTEHGRVRPLFM